MGTTVRVARRWACIVVLLAGIVPASASAATTYYVDNDSGFGNDANACTASSAPCRTITAAVGKAAAGDTVDVGGGTYAENVSISKALTLEKSDFAAGHTAGNVLVTGGATGTVLSATTTTGAVTVDGLTIAPSTARSQVVVLAGQVLLLSSTVQSAVSAGTPSFLVKASDDTTLAVPTFDNDVLTLTSGNAPALWINDASGTPALSVTTTQIHAPGPSPAVTLGTTSQMTMTDSSVRTTNGTAVSAFNGTRPLDIERSHLVGGGGQTAVDAQVHNDVTLDGDWLEGDVTANDSTASAYHFTAAGTLVTHELSVQNYATTLSHDTIGGAGLYITTTDPVTIESTWAQQLSPGAGTPCSSQRTRTTTLPAPCGATALDDPGFVDPANGDFHLKPTSALVDQGIATSTDDELDGDPRVVDGDADHTATSDIGADEYVPLQITGWPGPQTRNTSVTFEILYDHGISSLQCSVDHGTPFTCLDPTSWHIGPLADGQHTFTAHSEDSTGATVTTESKTFTVDTVAPTLTLTSSFPSPGNDPTPTFTLASSESGGEFTCSLDDGAPTVCASPFTTPALADGQHHLRVWAFDAAGNRSTPKGSDFVVDTTAPVVTLTSQPSGTIRSSTATVAFNADDGSTDFTCQVDAAAAQPCTSPFTTPALADGAHTIAVVATDPAGNTSAPATARFTVDTSPPSAATPPPPPPASTTTSPTPTGGASTSPALLTRLRIAAASFKAGKVVPALGGHGRTVVTMTLGAPATLKLTIFVATAGRKGRKAGPAIKVPAPAGAQRLAFSGYLAGAKPPRRGRYLLSVIPIATNGVAGPEQLVAFRLR